MSGSDRVKSIEFDQDIAPLLAHRCLECHNTIERENGLNLSTQKSAMLGGESGEVIVSGKPGESLLWHHVRDDEMPPKKPLPKNEKELLRRWIAEGAKWGTDPIDPFRFTTDHRAGYDWWSLQPVEISPLPTVSKSAWQRNGIDAFVLANLEANDLYASSEADRCVLIRRLSFGLLGLPPTPEQVTEFLNDSRPDAYDRLVDRLLASPSYGIRWGRHWLDIVRFGESQGFERDKLRPNSWPYRDWIVDALNRDMPYNEFVRQQIAGDVLYPGQPDPTIATGFLVAGAWDEVGNSQQSAAMKRVVRQDELEDLAAAVGQTFLGLTVNCARCHDHKFDPVTQKEYYQLTAALAGVRHGEREVVSIAAQKRSVELRDEIEQRRQQIAAIDGTARQRILNKRNEGTLPRPTPPTPIASWSFGDDLKDAIGTLHGKNHGNAKLSDGSLLVDGKSSYVASAPLKNNIREKTLEAWVRLDNLTQRGGAAISIQNINGGQFDAIVFGEREPKRWMAGSNGFVRTESFQGFEEKEANKAVVHVAIVYRSDGTIIGYRNGQPYGKPYKSNGPVTFKAEQAHIVFGLRHSPAGGNRLLAGAIDAAQLYDRALTAKEVEASAAAAADGITQNMILAELTATESSQRKLLVDEITSLTHEQDSLKPRKTYAVSPRTPEVAHVLHRGNPAAKRDVVSPGGVASLIGTNANFGLSPDASDSDRRIMLAEWITHESNPLFARVIVNRLWQYHFGAGLVKTSSDFGFNGTRPSHPELIDFLATELIRSGWSLKHVHRLIVSSATYRQASRHNDRAAEQDAGNRLLWRKTPARLEAEALRDSTLLIADQLNGRMGGPGYQDFDTFVRNTQFYTMKDVDGPQYNRRSIYRTWVRSGRSPFLDAFDCPDPSTKTPKRAVTITPLQALTLMNNSFVLRMVERLAARVQRESGDDVEHHIARVFDLVFSRKPDTDELKWTAEFVNEHGFAALCRVLLNSNEFLYVD